MPRLTILPAVILCWWMAASSSVRADVVPRLAGIVGRNSDGKPTLDVREGPHRGTFVIVPDIKGLVRYIGAHIVVLDGDLGDASIDFQKFEWDRLEDFMLGGSDLLPKWELPERFGQREISGDALKHLPSSVRGGSQPTRGIAQRLVVHVGDELHTYQIRYYQFPSASAAAMFTDRWSGTRGVLHDSTEHFRRAFDKIGVWVLNADDERRPPDYWIARFVLESLSRKALITMDTAVIFNKKNADAVVFRAEPDTVDAGDTLVLFGQGFTPIMQDNVVLTAGPSGRPLRTISATSHQLTVEVPRDMGEAGHTVDIALQVMVRHYARTNPVTVHVRR